LFILFMLQACHRDDAGEILSSPDGNIRINVIVEGGKPRYEVWRGNNVIIKKSGFSFEFRNHPPLDDSLTITGIERSNFDETWRPVCGTSERIRNHYNEEIITFEESGRSGRSYRFVARAYNDGVAFRYAFPRQRGEDSMWVMAEKTEFTFPANDSAWWIPADEFAYESLYRHTALENIAEANTPITVETHDGFYVSIHEAALRDYSEMSLKKKRGDLLTFVSSLWSEPDGVCAHVGLPFQTPWRCIMIARKPGDLVESHLIQNLNDPCTLEDVSWIKPMKFVGVWWGMHTGRYTWYAGPHHGATTERTKEYIDFAASHGIGGVLAEGWNAGWETWGSGGKNVQDFCRASLGFNLEEVVRYAKAKNVEFIAHHETGGNIPEYERQLEAAFGLCRSLGINAVKTGYAGPIIPEGYHHHGQYMVKHFQKVVETAARYHIVLDVHESIKPTGLDRTWPNLLTQEAARGNEWNATYKATPPYHTTILPFTRLLAGPYDYTPGIFHIIHSPDKGKRLYCTLANQLALFVVVYSPLMMVSDMIENYQNNPAFKFVEEVPCTWDETRVIEARLGQYVSIARRKKDTWFIGSLADEYSHLVKIPLRFLEPGKVYVATVYGDSLTTRWKDNPESIEIGEYIVTSTDTIFGALSNAGGHAVKIAPLTSRDRGSLPPIAAYNNETQNKLEVFGKLQPYGHQRVTHRALNRQVVLATSYSDRYPASGKSALTDGERGTLNYSAGGWQGYEGADLDATVDMQPGITIHKILVGFLSSPNDWIFFPRKVEFFISGEGREFRKVGEESFSLKKPADLGLIEIHDFSAIFAPVSARYVRVRAHSIISCPAWHPGRGKKAWVFCDEIMVE
jgi:hypothetical protein